MGTAAEHVLPEGAPSEEETKLGGHLCIKMECTEPLALSEAELWKPNKILSFRGLNLWKKIMA